MSDLLYQYTVDGQPLTLAIRPSGTFKLESEDQGIDVIRGSRWAPMQVGDRHALLRLQDTPSGVESTQLLPHTCDVTSAGLTYHYAEKPSGIYYRPTPDAVTEINWTFAALDIMVVLQNARKEGVQILALTAAINRLNIPDSVVFWVGVGVGAGLVESIDAMLMQDEATFNNARAVQDVLRAAYQEKV